MRRDPNETGRIHRTGLIAEDGSEITLLLPDSDGNGNHGIQMGGRLLVIVAALALTACGVIGWSIERAGCGLKCPKYSSCKVVQSGVFTASYGCVCDYAEWSYPSKGHPCPAPSPSPAAK